MLGSGRSAVAGRLCAALSTVACLALSAAWALEPAAPSAAGGLPCETPTAADLNNRRLDVELDYNQVDARVVVAQVVGETLGYPYVIDPAVTGQVSLRTQGRLSPNEVLAQLSSALSSTGNVLIVRPDSIFVAPTAAARSGVSAPSSPGQLPPGYVTTTIALRVARSADITRLIASVAPNVSVLYVDDARNLVLVAGAREDIQALQQVINVFDSERALEMSHEVIQVSFADPDRLAEEANRVLSRLQIAPVEIVPFRRLGSIVVIARSRQSLGVARDWVARLDIPSRGGNWRVYQPRFASAAHLASVLGALTGGEREPQAPASGASAPSGRWSVDPRTNTLVLIADNEEWAQLERVLEQLDVPQKQVLIEATIVEVALTDELRFGLNWVVDGTDGSARFSDNTNGSVAGRFPGFSFAFADGDVFAVLNALASRTDVQVISSPRVLTLDGEEATLRVGDEVPIVTQTAQSTQSETAPIVTTLTYRGTGVLLTVKPHVDGRGNVIIEVAQEVSDVARTTTSGIDSPTFRQRRIESRLSVADGRTIILGGLIASNDTRGRDGVPLLRDVPVLGRLFSSSEDSTRRTELLVFLTPHVLDDGQAGEGAAPAVPAEMEEMRSRGLGPGQ